MNTTTFQLILIILLIYLAWYLLHQIVFHRAFCRPANRIVEFFYYRFSGFVFLGLFSYWIAHKYLNYSISDLGIGFELGDNAQKYVLAACIVLPLLMLWIGPKKENLWQNPKMRADRWTWSLVFLSALSWILYLFAYEFFFRGFLLFPCIQKLGLTWAIIVNVLLYTSAHIDQGRSMIIGSIVFSIVLSLISYHTGSFFAAFIIHVINALCNEWISLYYHPDMKVKAII